MRASVFRPFLKPNAEPEELQTIWQKWAASESQLRALLGHYILDGQLSAINRQTPAVRHALNFLPLGSRAGTFNARTSAQWAQAYREECDAQAAPQTFCDIFLGLFDLSSTLTPPPNELSFLSIATVLEGLQSFICDFKQTGGHAAIGVPGASAIGGALSRAYELIASCLALLSSSEKSDLIIRWHAICIDFLCDIPALAQFLGTLPLSTATLGAVRPYRSRSVAADRRALLHAIELIRTAETRPSSLGSPVHLLGSLYMASRVLLGCDIGARQSSSFAGLYATSLETASGVDWTRIASVGMEGNACSSTPRYEDSPGTTYIIAGGNLLLDGRPFRTSYTYISAISLAKNLGHTFGIAEEFVNRLNEDDCGLADN